LFLTSQTANSGHAPQHPALLATAAPYTTIAAQDLLTAKPDPVLVEWEGHVLMGRAARSTAIAGRVLNSAQQLQLLLLRLLPLLLRRVVRLRRHRRRARVRINGISVLAKAGQAHSVVMRLLFALTIVFGSLNVSERMTSLVRIETKFFFWRWIVYV
jgi:hypothetical protein